MNSISLNCGDDFSANQHTAWNAPLDFCASRANSNSRTSVFEPRRQPSLPCQCFSQSIAINAAGRSVGFSDIAGGGTEAVYWSPQGKATNLGAVLGSAWSDTAVGINNKGDIIGYGEYDGGRYGFLLTPVSTTAFSAAAAPEPSTWPMLLAGFARLGSGGYRRAKKGQATLTA
jgi:hypothetical protein